MILPLSVLKNALIAPDTHDKVEKLLAQIMELENEKQKSHEQFSAQRGQLKKLFLQKEGTISSISGFWGCVSTKPITVDYK